MRNTEGEKEDAEKEKSGAQDKEEQKWDSRGEGGPGASQAA